MVSTVEKAPREAVDDKQRKPLVILVVARNISHGPRFFNVPKVLSENGFRSIIIGYHDDPLKKVESLGQGAKILRLKLRSKKIKNNYLRKVFAILEFLCISLKIVKRYKPRTLITFNEPASIILALSKILKLNLTRVGWLLEFPEFENMNLLEALIYRSSISCWSSADIIISPTRERLALNLSLNKKCLEKEYLVIQNSPLKSHLSHQLSTCSKLAIQTLAEIHQRKNLAVVYAGGIGKRYAIDSLIHAVGNLDKSIELLLLGKKHSLSNAEVTDALKQVKFPERIHWIDEISYRELQSVLSYADIGFAAYRGDTLNTLFSASGKIYEYLKAGLIIIADEQNCIAREVLAYQCGRLCSSPIDEQGIKKVLDQILEEVQSIEDKKLASKQLFYNLLCFEQQISPLLERIRAR